eukprot:6188737-Pleurochrysis_carterae.AAC.1
MTFEYFGVRVSFWLGVRSCQASETQVSGNSSHELRCRSQCSAFAKANKPGREVPTRKTEERSKTGARQPRMN